MHTLDRKGGIHTRWLLVEWQASVAAAKIRQIAVLTFKTVGILCVLCFIPGPQIFDHLNRLRRGLSAHCLVGQFQWLQLQLCTVWVLLEILTLFMYQTFSATTKPWLLFPLNHSPATMPWCSDAGTDETRPMHSCQQYDASHWRHQFSRAVTYTRLTRTRLNVEADLATLAEKSTAQPADLKLNLCCASA